MASAITWRSCWSATGSPEVRSFSASAPKMAVIALVSLAVNAAWTAFAASSGVSKRFTAGAGVQACSSTVIASTAVEIPKTGGFMSVLPIDPSYRRRPPPPLPPRLALPLELWARALPPLW